MPSTESLIRETRAVLDRFGVPMGPSKVSRLVRTYQHQVARNGFPFADYIVNNVQVHAAKRTAMVDELRRVISYADPTGETVARAVDRGRTSLGDAQAHHGRAGVGA